MDQINSNLVKEGQHSLIIGNINIAGDDYGRVFTMSDDGENGYILEGDKPMGTHFQKVCIKHHMMNLNLFDNKQQTVPEKAKIEGDRDITKRICLDIKSKNSACGYHNDILETASKNGLRIMFQGVAVTKDAIGSYVPELMVSILGHEADMSGGALAYTTKQGALTLAEGLLDMSYTPYALQKIGRDLKVTKDTLVATPN